VNLATPISQIIIWDRAISMGYAHAHRNATHRLSQTMMRPDPRHLSNLVAVAQHSSITRAAAARGISQPALSNSIAILEKRLGVKLIERGRHGSQMTPFGEIVVRQARAMETLLSDTVEEVRQKLLGSEGPLRIGVTPIAAASLIPDPLTRLMKNSPTVPITVVEGPDDELLEELLARKIELVIGPIMLQRAHSAVSEEILSYDPLSLVVARSSPLSKRRSVSLNELKRPKWVLPTEGSAYRRQVEAIFLTSGVPWPEQSTFTNSVAVMEACLLKSGAVAIVSRLLFSPQAQKRLACIPLKEAGRARALGIMRMRGSEPSPAATRLLEYLRSGSIQP
jgi:LysR family transcriptional regulator of gallate degradation